MVKAPVVKPIASGPVAPGIARAPRVAGGGPKVGGFLAPNSAIGIVYTRLEDQQIHNMKDVIDGLVTGDPVGRVKQLARYGVQKGGWTVTINGEDVQMILHTPQQAQPAAQTVQP
jgi:hypothetical protein